MSSPNPASAAFAVTPSDAVNLSQGECRGLYVGVGGNLSLVMADNTVVSFLNAQSGSVIPVECKRVNATGTTATNVVALY